MLKRLRAKFIGTTMTILVTMLVAILSLILAYTKEDMNKQTMEMMQQLAEGPVQSLSIGSRSNARPYFIISVDRNGDMSLIGSDTFDLSSTEMMQNLLDVAILDSNEEGYIWEYGLRYYRVVTPTMHRVIFADISSSLHTMFMLYRISALILVLGSVLFYLLSLLLARWAIRPVDQAWQQQKQFVADASHELKTPLTAIITNAEMLQESAPVTPQQAKYAGSIVTVSQQMRILVERLLTLARVDNGQVRNTFEVLDFSALTEDALLPLEAVFFERDLLLESSIAPKIRVKGSYSHLMEVVEILLDNAQKYAQGGNLVRLELKKSGLFQCMLTVSNPGPAMTEQQLKLIFKRFYRIDESRSMNRSYGLGLPIAEGIVKEHHGKIWAECRDGIVKFFVTLPTVP